MSIFLLSIVVTKVIYTIVDMIDKHIYYQPLVNKWVYTITNRNEIVSAYMSCTANNL